MWDEEQWQDSFAAALYLDLRKGELFALKKSDINLATMTPRSSART